MTFKPGLTPVSRLGAADSGQVNRYRVKNNTPVSFFTGQVVRVSNGFLQPALNTSNPVGVFAGGMWIDPTSKRPVRSLFIPSGTSTEGGLIDGLNTSTWGGNIALVYDDPKQQYVVAALASIFPTAIGAFAQLGDNTTGSSYSGRANTAVSLGTGTSLTNAAFIITGIPTYDNQVGSAGVSAGQTSSGANQNTWEAATTRVQVILAKHLYERGAV
jgi:hypothetical protein